MRLCEQNSLKEDEVQRAELLQLDANELMARLPISNKVQAIQKVIKLLEDELTYLDPNPVKERRGRPRVVKPFSSTQIEPSRFEHVEREMEMAQKRKRLPKSFKAGSKKFSILLLIKK